MLENISTYASLSSAVYLERTISEYDIIYKSTPSTDGFEAIAYGKHSSFDTATGKYSEIIISYAGSIPLNDIPATLTPEQIAIEVWQDWVKNDILQIGVGQKPSQYTSAEAFYNWINNHYASDNTIIELTGHSLGGALAQLIGANTGCNTVTFNAPGVLNAAINEALAFPNSSNITNYVVINDIIGSFSSHIGQTYYIMPYEHTSSELDNLAPHGDYETTLDIEFNQKLYFDWDFKKALAVWLLDKNNNITDYAAVIAGLTGINSIYMDIANLTGIGLDLFLESELDLAVKSILSAGTPPRTLHYRKTFGDYIIGDATGNEANTLQGTNSLLGLGGNDTIWGNEGDDSIIGVTGSDEIYGGADDDTIFGNDTIVSSGDGKNKLYGDGGNDKIIAGDNNDFIDGGSGNIITLRRKLKCCA